MAVKTIILVGILIYFLQAVSAQGGGKRLVCYYDTESSMRLGYAKFSTDFLDKSLVHCTHLVYASAHVDPKTCVLYTPYRFVNPKNLRRRYPHLKIYLSVGGDKDDNDKHDPLKYVHLLESPKAKQLKFINSSMETLNSFGFHGLDLAFPLPRNKPREESSMGMFLNDLNSKIWGDTKTDVYKHHYTRFVSDLKEAFDKAKLSLIMTVLPNVNSTLYFDIAKIHNDFEFINLFAFDFHTPERNPNEADYSAPLYFNREQNRLSYANVDFQVNYWLNNACPAQKINLGISTHGRAWKLTVQSGLSGQPVVEDTAGPGGFGNRTLPCGSVSWTDICFHLPPQRRRGTPLRKISDRYGHYAFRTADKNNQNGIWISYDDPDFAATKAKYAKDKSLGGVVLDDLGNDDFKGLCRGEEHPILQSVRTALDIAKFPEPITYAGVLRRAT